MRLGPGPGEIEIVTSGFQLESRVMQNCRASLCDVAFGLCTFGDRMTLWSRQSVASHRTIPALLPGIRC